MDCQLGLPYGIQFLESRLILNRVLLYLYRMKAKGVNVRDDGKPNDYMHHKVGSLLLYLNSFEQLAHESMFSLLPGMPSDVSSNSITRTGS